MLKIEYSDNFSDNTLKFSNIKKFIKTKTTCSIELGITYSVNHPSHFGCGNL